MHILEIPAATANQHVHMCEWLAETAEAFSTGQAVMIISTSLPAQILFASSWTQAMFF